VKAAKRNRAVSESWLRKRIERLKENRAFREELKGIIALQKTIWHGHDFSHELTGFACLAVSPGQSFRATLDRAWASKACKTWKAIKEFPRRLQKLADEVAQVNASDRLFFVHRRNDDLNKHEIERIGWICRQLPENMRVYAEALKERNAAIEVSTRRGCPALVNLSLSVEQLTGAYYDDKIAGLLNAADIALNEEKKVRFSAQSVAQARYRFRRKNRLT
jgi:hypothetical protein